MMQTLLARLREEKIKLWVADGRLRYSAPKGGMKEELLCAIKDNKEDIIVFLQDAERQRDAYGEIIKAPEGAKVPASYSQESMWFVHHYEGEMEPGVSSAFDSNYASIAYNVQLVLNLEWVVSDEDIHDILTTVVSRHRVFGTAFVLEAGSLIQEVKENVPLEFKFIDVSSSRPQEELISSHAKTELNTRFDLTSGRLARAKVLRFAPDRHVLIFTTHHIVFDGWSMGVFVHELYEAYLANSESRTHHLKPLKTQYTDYAFWQHSQITDAYIERFLRHWSTYMNGAPSVLALPLDKPRPKQSAYKGDVVRFSVPRQVVGRIRGLIARTNSTLYAVCLAVFALVLRKYTSQEDIVVGSPVANRSHVDLEALIGDFVNLIVVRLGVDGDLTWQELVSHVNASVQEAMQYEGLPFEKLVEVVRPERMSGVSPIFQVMFSLQNTPVSRMAIPGLTFNNMRLHTGATMYDLSLSMEDHTDTLMCELEFNVELFERESVERISKSLLATFERVADCEDQRVRSIDVLSSEEKSMLLNDFSGAASDSIPADDASIVDTIFEHAKHKPHKVAVVWQDTHMTYHMLAQRVDELARILAEQGVREGQTVAIMVPRSHELITAVLASWRLGAAFLPLDSSLPKSRLEFMIADAAPTIIVCVRDELVRIHGDSDGEADLKIDTVDEFFGVQVLCLDELDQRTLTIGQSVNGLHSANIILNSPAYIIYTSGTTGKPKAVQVTHRNLIDAHSGWIVNYQVDETDNHLQMANFTFDVFVGDIVRSLATGGSLILCPRDVLLDPQMLYELMVREQITCAEFVPAVVEILGQHLKFTGDRLAFLRLLIVGSDLLQSTQYAALQALVGPQTRIINSYGVTEATIDTTWYEPEHCYSDNGGVVPIGKPLCNRRVYIVDEALELQPVGVVGELCIGGRCLSHGYLGRADLTAEKFVPNPFLVGSEVGLMDDRLYRTGDRARFRGDGTIEFAHREDGQVKIRGYRVELGEVEAKLISFPWVRTAVAAAAGQGGARKLVAFIVLNASSNDVACASSERIDSSSSSRDRGDEELRILSSIKANIAEALPEYMVPSHYILLESLPLTWNGKVDRQTLGERAKQLVNNEMSPFKAVKEGPVTETETTLTEIWADVLSSDMSRISVTQDFFEIGGQSILAAQVVSRIRERIAVNVSIRAPFDHRTIRDLGRHLDILRERNNLVISATDNHSGKEWVL